MRRTILRRDGSDANEALSLLPSMSMMWSKDALATLSIAICPPR